MVKELCIVSENELVSINKKDVDLMINKMIMDSKEDIILLSDLTLECTSLLSSCDGKNDYLENQSTFKKIIGTITGKNKKIRDEISKNNTNAMYAIQQTINIIMKKYVNNVEFMALLNDRVNKLSIELKESSIEAKSDISQIREAIVCFYRQYQEEYKQLLEKVSEHEGHITQLNNRLQTLAVRCSGCGNSISSYQLVCDNCGEIVKVFPYKFTDLNVEEKCVIEVSELSKIIKEIRFDDNESVYPELNDMLLKMEKIRKISFAATKKYDGEARLTYAKIYKLSQRFFNDYKRQKIEIAVVGTVKSGKSSLINSLIGTSLASVDPTPETSTLVKYRTTSKGNYLKVSFYNTSQWTKLWKSVEDSSVFKAEYDRLNADVDKLEYINHKEMIVECSKEDLYKNLMIWSKSDSPKHFFVREIEVGYESDAFPHDVYLVDTPGLSDPVKYRSDITRKYIRQSDWILACIVGENLSQQSEFNFLSKVIANKGNDVSKVFVVATKKDMLTIDECNKKQKEFLIRLGELYNSDSMAISRFSFVAAEMHLLTQMVCKGEKLTKEEEKKLKKALLEIDLDYQDINSKKSEIFNYAGVDALFERIDNNVLKNRRKNIISSVIDDYNKCMDVIKGIADSYIDDEDAYLKTVISDRNYDQKIIEKLREKDNDLSDLQIKIKDIRKRLEKEIKNTNG